MEFYTQRTILTQAIHAFVIVICVYTSYMLCSKRSTDEYARTHLRSTACERKSYV